MPDSDAFSKSDPMVVVFVKNAGGQFELVGKTEFIKSVQFIRCRHCRF